MNHFFEMLKLGGRSHLDRVFKFGFSLVLAMVIAVTVTIGGLIYGITHLPAVLPVPIWLIAVVFLGTLALGILGLAAIVTVALKRPDHALLAGSHYVERQAQITLQKMIIPASTLEILKEGQFTFKTHREAGGPTIIETDPEQMREIGRRVREARRAERSH